MSGVSNRWSNWGDIDARGDQDWRQCCQQRYRIEKEVVHLLDVAVKQGLNSTLVDEDDLESFDELVQREEGISLQMVDLTLEGILGEDLMLVDAEIVFNFAMITVTHQDSSSEQAVLCPQCL